MRTGSEDGRLHAQERGLWRGQPCPHLISGLQPGALVCRCTGESCRWTQGQGRGGTVLQSSGEKPCFSLQVAPLSFDLRSAWE